MNNKYSGMTVNERLHLSGLVGQFDKVLLEKDTKTLVSILREVELNDENINAILKIEKQKPMANSLPLFTQKSCYA